MNCSVAIQVLPLDSTSDEETCRVVDEVIASIAASGVRYYVGPFETAIEGDYDLCMNVLKNCQLVAAKAGCGAMMCYAKIDYRPAGDVMTTEHKVGKYHADDASLSEDPAAADGTADAASESAA